MGKPVALDFYALKSLSGLFKATNGELYTLLSIILDTCLLF